MKPGKRFALPATWLLAAVFILLLILISGCLLLPDAPKTISRRTQTSTPFLPKATFTLTPEVDDISLLAPSQTNTPEEITPTAAATAPNQPSATPENTDTSPTSSPTAAASPTEGPAANTPAPTASAVPSNTPRPSSTPAKNPSQPTATQKPPTATQKPAEPTDSPPPTSTFTKVPPTETPAATATSQPTASPVPQGCTYSGNATYENQVVNLINQERQDRGLSPLSKNASLRQAARRHSQDMACNDHFKHTGTDGSNLASRLSDAGYSYSWAAENIAASSSQSFSPQAVVNMWMNSSGHRQNILSSRAKHIGVGFRYVNNNQGFDAYYTADFGRP